MFFSTFLLVCLLIEPFHQGVLINAYITYTEDGKSVQFHKLAKRNAPMLTEDNYDLPLPSDSSAPDNLTHVTVDHKYYEVKIYKPESNKINQYWIDVDNLKSQNSSGKVDVVYSQLSNSYRRAVNQKLKFQFPFYGHMTENVTIATGGFVYVGEYIHNWLAATQYIAPLMANFDTTTSNFSHIRYADTGDTFIVEWNRVVLHSQRKVGDFTFQLSLHKNGDMWLVYKKVPIPVGNISDAHHPRKVGLSDAYLFSQTILSLNRKIIYEYHRIEIPLEDVKSGTVVEIKANPVCISFTNCWDCTSVALKDFNCSWCHVPESHGSSFCSDEAGLHRRRQDWLTFECKVPNANFQCQPPKNGSALVVDKGEGSTTAKPLTTDVHPVVVTQQASTATPTINISSPLSVDKTSDHAVHPVNSEHASVKSQQGHHDKKDGGLSSGGIVCMLLIAGTVLCVAGWVAYAYNNPQSRSGQLLIRYRPSRWRFNGNRSDIRYTASVHM